MFFDYQNLLERIRTSYDQTLGASNKETYRNALDTEILVLDDLGAHRVTDWVEDTVTALITHRYNNRKPLIATTNLVDPEITGSVIEKSALASAPPLQNIDRRANRRARPVAALRDVQGSAYAQCRGLPHQKNEVGLGLYRSMEYAVSGRFHMTCRILFFPLLTAALALGAQGPQSGAISVERGVGEKMRDGVAAS